MLDDRRNETNTHHFSGLLTTSPPCVRSPVSGDIDALDEALVARIAQIGPYDISRLFYLR